jgi:uncharacterized protein YqgC (DUF456 family)
MDQSSLVALSTVLMVVALIMAFLPVIPGATLMWAVGTISAVVLQFERVTQPAVIAMTIFMIIGVTSDFWLPLFGLQSGKMTCLTSLGGFAGGLLGTFFIPIPILGTFIGYVVGAALVEFVQRRRLQETLQTGREAAKIYLLSYVIGVITSIVIFVIFIVSIITTG